MLYGVETKHINQALKNNPDKFPAGYVFELDTFETKQLIDRRENFAVKIFDRKIEQDESTERISSNSRQGITKGCSKGHPLIIVITSKITYHVRKNWKGYT